MRSTLTVLLLVAAGYFAPAIKAAPIQPGTASYEYSNVFVSRIFPGVPGINPGPEPLDLKIISTGVFVTEWDAQVGDTIPFEITSAVATGELGGMPFEIFAGIDQVPELGPFAGAYTNVVQDELDPGFPTGDPSSLVFANVSLGGPFAQVLADGTRLYTDTYNFEGSIPALPYPVGSQFVGSNNAEVRVQLGPTPSSMDPVIGIALAGGVVEVTRVIPEPTSSTLILLLSCVCFPALRHLRQ